MPESPEDVGWLMSLVQHTPLLRDRRSRQHWLRILPVLSAAERYELAALLVEIERASRVA